MCVCLVWIWLKIVVIIVFFCGRMVVVVIDCVKIVWIFGLWGLIKFIEFFLKVIFLFNNGFSFFIIGLKLLYVG